MNVWNLHEATKQGTRPGGFQQNTRHLNTVVKKCGGSEDWFGLKTRCID